MFAFEETDDFLLRGGLLAVGCRVGYFCGCDFGVGGFDYLFYFLVSLT